MAKVIEKIQNTSGENIPEKKDSLAENIKGLTDKALNTFYDKIVNIINDKNTKIDKLKLKLDKNASTNVHSLEIRRKTKEITNLKKRLKLIVHEMSRRIQADYENK
jgi:CRISPR/Cas system CSM-associated protein Csm2 small subunit